MATPLSNNLAVTIAHAITFLTRPLIASHSATAIVNLQVVLEANLTALYAPTWVVGEPLRGSGRRCLTLSPDCLPPRPIYSACVAAGVQWFEWIALLGNREFDLFIDPGCVSVRYSRNNTPNGKFVTVWVDEIPSSAIEGFTVQRAMRFQAGASAKQSKTLAQQLLEDDHEEDDQIFSMIADEIRAPTWMTPIHAEFPAPARSLSPLSLLSAHSRSSSRSSNSSSSGFSYASTESSATSMSTLSSLPPKAPKQSRRERARLARVFVDTSKTEVTPYDGGKTTVLTGGVMLGGARGASKHSSKPNVVKPTSGPTTAWRSTRT